MRPFAIDLCCGLGGFTEGLMKAGLDVYGFDVLRLPGYPGKLVLQDVRTLDGSRFRGASVIVAAPPCQEYSRHDQPWTRAKNPPPPDLSIWRACERIAREAGVPLVIENVRGAQRWVGKSDRRIAGRHYWGAFPPVRLDGIPAKPGKYCLTGWGDSSLRPWIRSKVQWQIGCAIGRWHGFGELWEPGGLFDGLLPGLLL
jgi:C-5 cytosine-specific DNA methylase